MTYNLEQLTNNPYSSIPSFHGWDHGQTTPGSLGYHVVCHLRGERNRTKQMTRRNFGEYIYFEYPSARSFLFWITKTASSSSKEQQQQQQQLKYQSQPHTTSITLTHRCFLAPYSFEQSHKQVSIMSEFLYHVKRTITNYADDKSGATRIVDILGTFTDLAAAKAAANAGLAVST